MEQRKVSTLAPYKIKDGAIHIFLQKRDKNAKRAPGLFGFFGGGAKEGETPEKALLREIKEELDFIPQNFNYFGTYSHPEILMNLFVVKVNEDFEKQIKILEGEYGKWLSNQQPLDEKDFVFRDLKILEELYQKLSDKHLN